MQELFGGSVSVINASNVVQTDEKERFNIGMADDYYTLVFRYLGYKKYEQQTNRNAELRIRLQEDPGKLDEVSVIGYQC